MRPEPHAVDISTFNKNMKIFFISTVVLLLVLNTSGAYLSPLTASTPPSTPAGPQPGHWQVVPIPDYCRHAIFKYQAKCKTKTVRYLAPSLPPAPTTPPATPTRPPGEWRVAPTPDYCRRQPEFIQFLSECKTVAYQQSRKKAFVR